MFAVCRLPESWTGSNFWVARAARGARASRIAPRTASLARCSDIPTSLVVGCRWFLGRRLGSAITGDLQCRRWSPPGGLHRLLTGWLGSLHQADVVVEDHRPRPGETGHGVDVAGPRGGYAEGRHRDLTRGELGKGARRPGDRHRWYGPPGPVDPRRAWTGLEARHGGVVVAAALAEPAPDVDAHHVARVRWILHHAHTGDPGAVVRAAAGGRAAVIGDRHAVGQVLRAGLGPP